MSIQFPYPFPERFRSRLMLHYRTRISGTEVQKKLPFRVLVLANLTGQDAHADGTATVPPLRARPIRSYVFGRTGSRVDDYMAEALPYTTLPKDLKTFLPGQLMAPKLTGKVSSGAKPGAPVRVKLSGRSEFVSTTAENGMCNVRGMVDLVADVDIDVGALPVTMSVPLRGSGKVRGLQIAPPKEEPDGVVAGVVSLSSANLTIQMDLDGNLEALLNPPPASPEERKDNAEADADRIAARAAASSTDAQRVSAKVAKLVVSPLPASVTDPLKTSLTTAFADITAFLTDATAATASYTAATAQGATASTQVDARRDGMATAPTIEEGVTKAEAGARQGNTVLVSVEAAGEQAHSAVDAAKQVVDDVNAVIDEVNARQAEIAAAPPADQIRIGSELAQKASKAVGRISSATAWIAKAKVAAEEATKRATDHVTNFDAEADAAGPTPTLNISAVAERVLPFESLSSFTPDDIVANVPELNRLHVIRDLLLYLQSEVRNVPDLRAALRTILKDNAADLAALKSDLAASYSDLAIAKTP